MKRGIIFCGWLLLASPQVPAQTAPAQPAQEGRLKALEERIQSLEAEVKILKSAAEEAKAVPPSAAPAPQPAAAETALAAAPSAGGGALPVYGGSPLAAKLLNPDISAIGDVTGAVGRNTVRPVPALELHEMEVGLQAIIDPYARGDVFISFGETGVNVEEAYLTFTSLPAGFVARVGKFRAEFGKSNTIHNHALQTIDRPLMSENLVAGEDGINDTGFSITHLIPAPKGLFLEGTAQVFRGDSGDVFTSSQRKDASVVGHLRGYHDISDSTNVDIGVSYARGHNNLGDAFITQLYGVDATLRWKPLRRSIYHSFLFRNEFTVSHRQETAGLRRAFGMYSLAEYRLNRRWTLGGRFDWADRARNPIQTDKGLSTLLTYWPSEFSQIRGQYRFTRYAENKDASELRFQFLFVMGAHGAHPF
jgi:hypothetical protein